MENISLSINHILHYRIYEKMRVLTIRPLSGSLNVRLTNSGRSFRSNSNINTQVKSDIDEKH